LAITIFLLKILVSPGIWNPKKCQRFTAIFTAILKKVKGDPLSEGEGIATIDITIDII